MRIFISYDQEDQAAYTSVCWALDGNLDGNEVERWDASTMSVGKALAEQLKSAIQECVACIFIASPRSVKSPWCMAELGAFWGTGKPVAIFVTDPEVKDSDFPPQFEGILWTKDFGRLINTVKGYLDAAVPESATLSVDMVYSDVENILSKLKDDEEGKRCVLKMRIGLNETHLERDPKFTVREVKDLLDESKIYTGVKGEGDDEITSDFVEAVMHFQRISGLEHVDGIIGPYTKKKLKELRDKLEQEKREKEAKIATQQAK